MPPGSAATSPRRVNRNAKSAKPNNEVCPPVSCFASLHGPKQINTGAECTTEDCPPMLLGRPATSRGGRKRLRKSCEPNEAFSPVIRSLTPSPNVLSQNETSTNAEIAASLRGLLVRPSVPIIAPFAGVFPMARLPVFAVDQALLRLPSLNKLAQMRDTAK